MASYKDLAIVTKQTQLVMKQIHMASYKDLAGNGTDPASNETDSCGMLQSQLVTEHMVSFKDLASNGTDLASNEKDS